MYSRGSQLSGQSVGIQTRRPWFDPLLEFSTSSTLSAMIVSRALLRLISLTVFNYTHTPVLSAQLLILSDSRFLVPDFPRSVPEPLYMECPSPSSPKETLSGLLQIQPKNVLFFENNRPPPPHVPPPPPAVPSPFVISSFSWFVSVRVVIVYRLYQCVRESVYSAWMYVSTQNCVAGHDFEPYKFIYC